MYQETVNENARTLTGNSRGTENAIQQECKQQTLSPSEPQISEDTIALPSPSMSAPENNSPSVAPLPVAAKSVEPVNRRPLPRSVANATPTVSTDAPSVAMPPQQPAAASSKISATDVPTTTVANLKMAFVEEAAQLRAEQEQGVLQVLRRRVRLTLAIKRMNRHSGV